MVFSWIFAKLLHKVYVVIHLKFICCLLGFMGCLSLFFVFVSHGLQSYHANHSIFSCEIVKLVKLRFFFQRLKMNAIESENGAQLFCRLSKKFGIKDTDPYLFQQVPHLSRDKCAVVELFGAESCGKTEIILNLIVNTILPIKWKNVNIGGLNSAVILIDNEFKFPFMRLMAIIEKRFVKYTTENVSLNLEDCKSFALEALENFVILNCRSSKEFVITLYSIEKLLKSYPNAILLCIENISSFGIIDGMSDEKNIYRTQTQIAAIFKKLLQEYKMNIVYTRPNFKLYGNYEEFYRKLIDVRKRYLGSRMEVIRFSLSKSLVTERITNQRIDVILCEQIIPSNQYNKSYFIRVNESGISYIDVS